MKNLLILFMTGFLLMLTSCEKDLDLITSDATFEADKNVSVRVIDPDVVAAVELGIDYLLSTQVMPDGYFDDPENPSMYERVARTALAVTKLCDRAIELQQNPMDFPGVQEGINYLLQHTHPKAGGLIVNSNPNTAYHETYNTSLALMAIAATRDQSYKGVADAIVTFFINSQNDDGGWRYYDTQDPSDQSNTGFVALGLLAAQEFGCDIPDPLKIALSGYIDATQNTSGGILDGGCEYVDTPSDDDWVNQLKTGNILFEMALVGDDNSSSRAQRALGFIERNWNEPAGDGWEPYIGWQPNHYLAMYTLMKGLVVMEVDMLGAIDWFDVFKTVILNSQEPGGSWAPNGIWIYDRVTTTALNLLTLEKVTPVPIIHICIDVKPTSCPNPVNRKSKGNTPIAILGTADFDVTTIDVATLYIVDPNDEENKTVIPNANWSYEDVATPFEGELVDRYSCTTAEGDGHTDLVLHFSTPAIAELLEGMEKGAVVVLEIRGHLVDDGLEVLGGDMIWLVK